MADKRLSLEEFSRELKDGMTIGIGGWGSRRKPMALVRAIVRSGVKNLTIISYGGPDVGILCATGQAKKVIFAFVSLDSIPLEAHFRNARQSGSIEAVEYDEGMFQWGLYAAAQRMPFLPCRAGLGSDVMRVNPQLKTVRSPYEDREEFVAMPALNMDLALIHMNRADKAGNGQYLNVDPYFDDLFAMAAPKCFMSCEQLIDTTEFLKHGPQQSLKINRMMTAGVITTPGGAHFTECPPDYGRDEAFQREYAASAKTPEAWSAFKTKFLDVPEADYQRQLAELAAKGGKA